MDAGGATAGGALRWSRALALAAVALLTGVIAHVSAGERVPAVGALAVLLAVVTCAAGPLLQHPASTRRVVLLLAAGETFVHFALLAMAGGPSGPGAPMTGAMAGMHHVPAPAHDLPLVEAWLERRWIDVIDQHASMTAAHLAAAMAVGLWLAAGERALWALLRLTLQPVTGPLAAFLSAYEGLRLPIDDQVPPAPTVHREERRPALAARACEVVARRGPPAASLRLTSS